MTDREFLRSHVAKLRILRDRGRVADDEMNRLVLDVLEHLTAHLRPGAVIDPAPTIPPR